MLDFSLASWNKRKARQWKRRQQSTTILNWAKQQCCLVHHKAKLSQIRPSALGFHHQKMGAVLCGVSKMSFKSDRTNLGKEQGLYIRLQNTK